MANSGYWPGVGSGDRGLDALFVARQMASGGATDSATEQRPNQVFWADEHGGWCDLNLCVY